MIADIGFRVAAALIAWTGKGWPDVVVCAVIAVTRRGRSLHARFGYSVDDAADTDRSTAMLKNT